MKFSFHWPTGDNYWTDGAIAGLIGQQFTLSSLTSDPQFQGIHGLFRVTAATRADGGIGLSVEKVQ